MLQQETKKGDWVYWCESWGELPDSPNTQNNAHLEEIEYETENIDEENQETEDQEDGEARKWDDHT